MVIKGGMFINIFNSYFFDIFFTSFSFGYVLENQIICHFKWGLRLFKGLRLLFFQGLRLFKGLHLFRSLEYVAKVDCVLN